VVVLSSQAMQLGPASATEVVELSFDAAASVDGIFQELTYRGLLAEN